MLTDKLLAYREKKVETLKELNCERAGELADIDTLTEQVIEKMVADYRKEIEDKARAEAEAKIAEKYDAKIKDLSEDLNEYDLALQEAEVIEVAE